MISVRRPLWELPGQDHARLLQRLVVGRVDLPAVAVALFDDGGLVAALRERARHEIAGLRPEPHGGAHVGHVLLLGQQVDDGVRRGRVELARVRALQTADVAGELDHRALQAQADPQERHAALAREAHRRRPCPRRPAPRTRRGSGCRRRRPAPLRSRTPPRSSDATHSIWTSAAVREPAVLQRLHHGEVGVAHVHVLADDRDRDGLGGAIDPVDERLPLREVRLGVDPQVTRELARRDPPCGAPAGPRRSTARRSRRSRR